MKKSQHYILFLMLFYILISTSGMVKGMTFGIMAMIFGSFFGWVEDKFDNWLEEKEEALK